VIALFGEDLQALLRRYQSEVSLIAVTSDKLKKGEIRFPIARVKRVVQQQVKTIKAIRPAIMVGCDFSFLVRLWRN